jgi:glyoxylase-like metal-dependent hydrolase (beta-lactamase superfamily II)
MIFRQLFDPETASYSYLLGDEVTREAVLIDSVAEQLERDVSLLRELDLKLVFALETHVHADHVTAAGQLREKLGARVAVSRRSGVHNADVLLGDGDWISFGTHRLEARATPGHTSGCMTFVTEGMAFTGDSLLIRGCGRTDFQEGDARTLFHSVRSRILTLPGTTALFPAHDYRGRTQSSVAEELRFNPRLGADRTVESFIELMERLTLSYPKHMDEAIPANLYAGLAPGARPKPQAPSHVAEVMRELGRQDAGDNWLGAGI